ncbi:MAG: hypothetical protein CMJ34_00195 [Phycisphaerae bacterium]|nr:hypothetical protein [Phycisphaerae bacterium]
MTLLAGPVRLRGDPCASTDLDPVDPEESFHQRPSNRDRIVELRRHMEPTGLRQRNRRGMRRPRAGFRSFPGSSFGTSRVAAVR